MVIFHGYQVDGSYRFQYAKGNVEVLFFVYVYKHGKYSWPIYWVVGFHKYILN